MTDLIELAVILWLIVGTGVVFYCTPLSVGAKRMRIITLASIFVCIVFLSATISVPMTTGDAYVSIGFPVGRGLRVPYRYGFFILRFWPVFGLISLTTAVIGPIVYLAKTRVDFGKK